LLILFHFKYWGGSEEDILDRLPTARVVKREGDVRYIEAEVFGRGIKMWLLSQAEYLEVLSPPKFRAEIEDILWITMELCGMVLLLLVLRWQIEKLPLFIGEFK